MSGPQPHSNQWPYDENETTEIHANMHECKEPILRHNMQLQQSMAKDEIWHRMAHDPALKYDAQWSRIMQTLHTMRARWPEYQN